MEKRMQVIIMLRKKRKKYIYTRTGQRRKLCKERGKKEKFSTTDGRKRKLCMRENFGETVNRERKENGDCEK